MLENRPKTERRRRRRLSDSLTRRAQMEIKMKMKMKMSQNLYLYTLSSSERPALSAGSADDSDRIFVCLPWLSCIVLERRAAYMFIIIHNNLELDSFSSTAGSKPTYANLFLIKSVSNNNGMKITTFAQKFGANGRRRRSLACYAAADTASKGV